MITSSQDTLDPGSRPGLTVSITYSARALLDGHTLRTRRHRQQLPRPSRTAALSLATSRTPRSSGEHPLRGLPTEMVSLVPVPRIGVTQVREFIGTVGWSE